MQTGDLTERGSVEGRPLRGRGRGARAGNGQTDPRPARAARAIGWFSLGLGIAQLAATGVMSRAILGADDRKKRRVLRAIGLREVAAGVGILVRPQSSKWFWARALGDAMDLALLGRALGSRNTNMTNVSVAASAVLGIGVLDVVTGRRLAKQAQTWRDEEEGVLISKSITINRPLAEVYLAWRDFQNLPRFMAMIDSVTVHDARRSHWRARGPAGKTIEWDAEVTEDRPNEKIAWRSVGRTLLPNAGEVRFRPAPGARGTQVSVDLSFQPPGGAPARALAKLFAVAPEVKLHGDLSRFKQLLELGEVVHSDASIARGMHPARPGAATATAAGRTVVRGGVR